MKNKNITASLVHYNEMIIEMMKRFPEMKPQIEKCVNKLSASKKYHRIIVGTTYSSRDSFPKSLTIKIECFDGSNPKPFVESLHFKSKWVLE